MVKNTTPGADNEGEYSEESLALLSESERVALAEKVKILYPRWLEIRDEIVRLHTMNKIAAEPQCLMIVGPTGAGKTTLIESYRNDFPTEYTDTGIFRPVLQVTIPSPATISNLATAILYALGDPRAERGTIGGKTQRVTEHMRDCGVELLVLDEIQHFVDRDSQVVLMNVSNWLKTLIKETKVACVLVGLQGEAEQVLHVNPQLARLFGDPRLLSPFKWDDELPETVQEFRLFLKTLDGLLPLPQRSGLASRSLAWRCFVASRGSISYLMALIRRACYLAIIAGRPKLDLVLLEQAFNQRLAGQMRGIANPFVGDPPKDLPPLSEPDGPSKGPGKPGKPGGKPGGKRGGRPGKPKKGDAEAA